MWIVPAKDASSGIDASAGGRSSVLAAYGETIAVVWHSLAPGIADARQVLTIGEAVAALSVSEPAGLCAASLWQTHMIAVHSYPDLQPLSRHPLLHGTLDTTYACLAIYDSLWLICA